MNCSKTKDELRDEKAGELGYRGRWEAPDTSLAMWGWFLAGGAVHDSDPQAAGGWWASDFLLGVEES